MIASREPSRDQRLGRSVTGLRRSLLRRKHLRLIAAVRIAFGAQPFDFRRTIAIVQIGPVVAGPRLVDLPVAGQHLQLEQRVDTARIVRGGARRADNVGWR